MGELLVLVIGFMGWLCVGLCVVAADSVITERYSERIATHVEQEHGLAPGPVAEQ